MLQSPKPILLTRSPTTALMVAKTAGYQQVDLASTTPFSRRSVSTLKPISAVALRPPPTRGGASSAMTPNCHQHAPAGFIAMSRVRNATKTSDLGR